MSSVTAPDCLPAGKIASRNADAGWVGSPEYRAALAWQHQYAEAQARRRLLEGAARRDARSCGRCGAAIGADAPVWIGGRRHRLPTGRECIPARELALDEGPYARPPARCDGCGRAVYDRGDLYRLRCRVVCSARCGWMARNRCRAERLAEARLMDCTVCGERFTPARSDASTCSPACRQKAYRRRAAL